MVDRLLDAGVVVAGETNMDELAFGPTTNPLDDDYMAGGSSSESATIMAAGDVDLLDAPGTPPTALELGKFECGVTLR